jgi:hypothetical protein
MSTKVRSRKLYEVESGLITSIDLSQLYFPDDADAREDFGAVRIGRRGRDLFAPLPTMVRWPAPPAVNLTLATLQRGTIAPHHPLSLPPVPKRNAGALPKIEPLASATYSVKSGEDRGRTTIELPFGMPRFVNAATLKAMLGADDSEVLFRKAGERWDVCPDSFRVDLKDRTQIFKLGKVQIFS